MMWVVGGESMKDRRCRTSYLLLYNFCAPNLASFPYPAQGESKIIHCTSLSYSYIVQPASAVVPYQAFMR